MSGKRVLVTGGSGFIPSHLVERLMQDGCEVAVTVRYGNPIKNERLKSYWDDIIPIEADLRNRGALEKGLQDFKPDTVYHLAAYNHVGQSFYQVEECFDVNAKGSANILDTCEMVGCVERFVYMSTSEVYGKQDSVPFEESMTPRPISPYAITKYSGELYCQMKQQMSGNMSIKIVRPFNVFGPYQSSKAVIPELILNCLNGNPVRTTKGEQTREFNYVDDIVDGLILAGNIESSFDGPINLAAAEEVSIRDLVLKIAELTESSSQIEIGAIPYRPTEIWRMYADNTRAQEVLGWSPKVSLEDGLTKTIDWFRDYMALK
jgi:UDP-glucose 4-epimerase